MTALTLQASAFVLPAHTEVRVALDSREPTVVATAFDLIQSDFQRVLDVRLQVSNRRAQVIVGTVGGPSSEELAASGVDLSWLKGQAQAFVVAVNGRGQLVVAGSDAYGTAYGLMELSRLIGVSPWEWWADVVPMTLETYSLPEGFLRRQAADVPFRGIHVSDIEWGLQPWITNTFEPGSPYIIGRKTARRIFELMLRLRLNLFWPPASEPATDFFATADGRSMATAYGIFLGSGVERPLMASNVKAPKMCVDDGFGYIIHFPTAEEVERDGSHGVYYHVSYKGAPHDYLWLGTASPFLMFQQFREAYYHGAYRLWVLNVGDIKPCEYQLTLFADMAWNLDSVRVLTVGRHLEEFYAENIGRDVARLLSIYMKEHFQLSFQCKPEHLAYTRVGDTDPSWERVRDLPWSEQKIRHRLTRYDLMRRNVEWMTDSVRHEHPTRYDAFFQLFEYPVTATIEQNEKFLLAQLARHGIPWLSGENLVQTWRRADISHNQVQRLTLKYNAQRNNKWQGIMSSNPAALQVFQPVRHTSVQGTLPAEVPAIATFYGASYQGSSFAGSDILDPVLGLGASIRAMPIPKDCNVTYKYKHNYGKAKKTNVEIRLLPTHPIEAQQRFTLSLDGCAPVTITYEAAVGSEEWKQNVLRGYALVQAQLPILQSSGEHSLTVDALDDGVVVDEVFIRN